MIQFIKKLGKRMYGWFEPEMRMIVIREANKELASKRKAKQEALTKTGKFKWRCPHKIPVWDPSKGEPYRMVGVPLKLEKA